MYPMDYLWIIVIAFGVISSIMNKAKTKSKDTPGSMPTFGGGGERSMSPRPAVESDDSYEGSSPGNRTQQEVYTQRNIQQSLSMPESDDRRSIDSSTYEGEYSPYLDHDTGEGVSQMWEDTKENRQLNMQEDINRATVSLSKISATSTDEWDAYATSDEDAKETHLTGITNPAVNGLIWSEILGPPRAKHAFSRRKL